MRFGPGRRALAVLACVALGSACSSSSGTTSPTPTPTPTVTSSGGATATPIAALEGVAYIPDGGFTPGSTGIYVVHFEDTQANLLPSGGPTSAPGIVRFPGAVGPIGFGPDGTTSIAAMSGGAASPFTLGQAVFGLSNASLIPVGTPYNSALPPTPTSSPIPTPTPNASQVVPDVTGAAIIGFGSVGVGLFVGPGSSGILGVSSLTSVPPQFGGFAPFAGTSAGGTPVAPPPGTLFYNIAVAPKDDTVVLVRGPSALEAFQITFPGSSFQFTHPIIDTTLGYRPSPILGRGAMAISPANSSIAILLQSPGANDVQYISGLPTAITKGSSVTLPSRPTSIAIVPNTTGNLAVVGTDAGFYVISGVNTGTLVVESPYLPVGSDGKANSPSYIGCDGASHQLANVTSIGISFDVRFIAALAHPTGSTCGSLVAVPLVDTTAGTPSPSPTPSPGSTNPPTLFVQNNLPVPSPNVDYMRVR